MSSFKRSGDRLKHNTFGQRGSAIIMALVTIMLLLMLGLAVATVSMGVLNNNVVDASNSDAYYAAKSAAEAAIEHLKYEVSAYYEAMLTTNSTDYPALYANFFNRINQNAIDNFYYSKPKFDGGITTDTTFTMGTFDSANSICPFLISSTATTADGSKYKFTGTLNVKKVDVRVAPEIWLDYDDAAYRVGGTLSLTAGFGVYKGGDVITSAFLNPYNCWYEIHDGGELKIESSIINDCLTYPSYSDPVIGNPDVYVTVNNTVLENGSFPVDKPVTILSAPGVSFTIDSATSIYPGSVVYCRGSNLTVKPTMTATQPIYCYCDGNITASNGPVYANLYARGNVFTSGNFHGTVYCDGNATIGNSFYGAVISGGNLNLSGGLNGSFFADGQINIVNGDEGNCIIYSKTKIVLDQGNYQNVVLFSGGDIDITGGTSLTGAIIAKRSVNQKAWLNLTYYTSTAYNSIIQDPKNKFFFSDSDAEPELNEYVFKYENIKPEGRQP